MSTQKIVSIVMPVHNAGAHLQAAVDSIIQQSYSNLELIIVDDHSTDGAIEKLNINDQRIKLYSSAKRGVVHAMQCGSEHARGDFIARMDADDESLPRRIEVQLDYLKQNPEVGIVGAQVEIFSDEELGGGFQAYQEWLNNICSAADIQRELFVESPLPNPTVMFRRQVYEQLGGYHDTGWAEDYDCWLRAAEQDIKMAKPEGILLRWRDHGRRLTRTDVRYSLDNFMRAKVHYLVQSRLQDKEVVIWGTGPTGVQFHDLLQQENIKMAGFIDIHPRRIGGQKRGLPVWSMDKTDSLKNEIILGAVGSRGARDEIRSHLKGKGLTEGKAFIFVA
jgi:glycosyltransferase involved in cell wall biosynthesis